MRAAEHDPVIIEEYVSALIREIELKSQIRALSDVPIGAVFFGGGTPSFLTPQQILNIGSALQNAFNLAECREYSFEFEVKSVTRDRVEALKQIGVTHARFGTQTFSPEYRELFNLTCTVEQIQTAVSLLRQSFEFVSTDVLYGMHGQTEEDFIRDIEGACELGINNLDFYPINNLVTQPRLHKNFRARGKKPVTGLTKFYMNLLLRQALHDKGFLPHNGHGYVRVAHEELVRNPVVTDKYSFVYHEHVLGYRDCDLLGFGVNAISSFKRYVANNVASRNRYIAALSEDVLPARISVHDDAIDLARSVCLALPYHGSIPKHWVEWNSIPTETARRLEACINEGLVLVTPDKYALTMTGWAWYSNLMHYLLPDQESAVIWQIVNKASQDVRRDIEISGLEDVRSALCI